MPRAHSSPSPSRAKASCGSHWLTFPLAGLLTFSHWLACSRSARGSLCVARRAAQVCTLAQGCPLLCSLNLWVCSSVSDAGICMLAVTCTHLESLDLRLCSKVSGNSVLAVASHCPRLHAFYLERAGRVDNSAVRALAKGCVELRVLDLGWCDIGDEALEALAHHCPQLSTINLAYCEAISDHGLELLCRGCSRLASLDIGGMRTQPCSCACVSPRPPVHPCVSVLRSPTLG